MEKNDSPGGGHKPLFPNDVSCPPPVFDIDSIPDDIFMDELYPLDWNVVDDLDVNWNEIDDPLMTRSSGCVGVDIEPASFPPPPSTMLVYDSQTVRTDLTLAPPGT